MEIPILMDTITAGVTLAAVAVALYFGVRFLRQTRDIQRSERKQNQWYWRMGKTIYPDWRNV